MPMFHWEWQGISQIKSVCKSMSLYNLTFNVTSSIIMVTAKCVILNTETINTDEPAVPASWSAPYLAARPVNSRKTCEEIPHAGSSLSAAVHFIPALETTMTPSIRLCAV